MPRKQGKISNQLQVLGQRLKEFREVHPPRTRLPEELWSAATTLARNEGVYRTARTLHLDYANLRRRVETSSNKEIPSKKKISFNKGISSKRKISTRRRGSALGSTDAPNKIAVPTAFVEMLGETIASEGSTAADCLIEVEGTGGARMRIRTRMRTAEVVSLVRDWRERAAETRGEGQE